MTIEKRIYDGSRAKEVLDNEVFQQVFADIEQELTQAWMNSPQRDVEGREKLFTSITMLKKVKACLIGSMETGMLASKELEHQRTLQSRLSDFVKF